MKKIFLLFALFGAMSFVSCNKEKETPKNVTVTETYRIRFGANEKMSIIDSTKAPLMYDLYKLYAAELKKMNASYGKTEWKIDGEGATEKEASLDADKKAIAIFAEMEPKTVSPLETLIASLEAKRTEGAAEIAKYPASYHFKIDEFAFLLDKIDRKSESFFSWFTLKAGSKSLSFEVVGGQQY